MINIFARFWTVSTWKNLVQKGIILACDSRSGQIRAMVIPPCILFETSQNNGGSIAESEPSGSSSTASERSISDIVSAVLEDSTQQLVEFTRMKAHDQSYRKSF